MNNKITKIVAEYLDHIEFDVSDIDMSQVSDTWIKWGTLNLVMKDGSTISIEGNDVGSDYKWPTEEYHYDDDYNHLDSKGEEE
tara:strand:+ start:616 stop:864 length:249 start_codon:yes stop_codon:yes gene_type:complete